MIQLFVRNRQEAIYTKRSCILPIIQFHLCLTYHNNRLVHRYVNVSTRQIPFILVSTLLWKKERRYGKHGLFVQMEYEYPSSEVFVYLNVVLF